MIFLERLDLSRILEDVVGLNMDREKRMIATESDKDDDDRGLEPLWQI